ncbi:MAG: coproporphyrinogen dehydrogenase HemZ [Clostridiales bacterium]|nr:coproporphyrinogen dehydrogenase HemZ [Clostridiales bacterium]
MTDAAKASGHVRFRSNHAGDASVLADLLHTYGCLLTDEGDTPYSPGDSALTVQWAPSFAGLTIAWAAQGKQWSHRESVQASGFMETEENRRRRILRLAVHRLLEKEADLREILQAAPGPWGTLTGVRPSKMIQRFLDQGLDDARMHSILTNDFGIEQSRSALLLQIGRSQRPFLPSAGEGRDRVSLYVGYPFCPSRCGYCSFPGYEAKRWRKWQAPYLQALVKEIRQVGEFASGMDFQVENLYIGGGTPTCMAPSQMNEVLWALRESFRFAAEGEWTVESGRPETLTDDMLEVFAAHPVSRICINPQSMHQDTLDRIGRRHAAGETDAAFARLREMAARKRIANWRTNCDLILGLPGEGLEEVRESLAHVLDCLRPDNVTLHSLAIKRGSAYKETQPGLPDRQLGLSMLARTREMMAEAGYRPYYLYRQKDSLAGGENVGYTLPGRECRYNIMMIEERQTILGMGAGSGSKFLHPGDWSLDNVYNPKDMIQYIERVDSLIKSKVDKLAAVR